MAEYLIQGESLTSIGDEIRTLQDLTTVLKPNEMATNLNGANAEVNTQTDIIAQISAALSGKSVDSGTIPTVEQATPTISINSNGLITATSIQLSGQVTGGTKTATQQLNTLGATAITPDTYAKTAVEAGIYTTGVITVDPIPDIYKDTTDATASINDILSGKTAYTAKGKIIGTIETKEESDLTAEGATVTTPAGYYPLPVSKTIANATQNTPAIIVDTNGLITATVTQTAGYVTEGSKSSTRQLNTINEITAVPSEQKQTIVSAGSYTLGAIVVDPIPEEYKNTTDATATANDILSGKTAYTAEGEITGTIITKNENDLTAEADTITVPAGYYESSVSKAISSAVQETPVIEIDENGLITATISQTAGYITSESKSGTKQLNIIGETTVTPMSQNQNIVESGIYTTGNIIVLGDENLIADNIKEGISIFGITGTHSNTIIPETVNVAINNEVNDNGICWYMNDQYQLQNIPIPLGITNFTCVKNSFITLSGDFYGLQANTNILQANEILTIDNDESIQIELIALEKIMPTEENTNM